jgi:hypothetical protein
MFIRDKLLGINGMSKERDAICPGIRTTVRPVMLTHG